MATKTSAVFLVIICTFMTSYAHVLWKIVSSRSFHDILVSWELWAGFAILAVAAGVLITAFKHGDVSVLFPIVATSYIWVTLLSYHYFAEPITAYKWVGVAGIVVGLTVLGKGNKLAEAKHGN